jgi:RHH-type transcriptional regulator, proline utilization regulon repressor / proline dehydrogenase / delta 1-pyrroline-5-carboxylate dehydrogenase
MPLIWPQPPPVPSPLRQSLRADTRVPEAEIVARLLGTLNLDVAALGRIEARASTLVAAVRDWGKGEGGIEAFLHAYDLSSSEGIVLMCLAEALLRIPDAETIDLLIRDKLGGAAWDKHLGSSDSLFVNASTWALMLTGKVLRLGQEEDWPAVFGRVVRRSGEPVIRTAVLQGMRILGRQFVMGRTIAEALERAGSEEGRKYRYSFDMLGEAALTGQDARRYLDAYHQAIDAIGVASAGRGPVAGPGISVKLSALHPRYDYAQQERVLAELAPSLLELVRHARAANIGLTIDAEEADRLDLSLELVELAARDPALAGWEGLGLAVQAYQRRSFALLDWLADLADRAGRRLMVRLVKGAYWDSEIKRAQEAGLSSYPVFTRKSTTDMAYLACAQKLLRTPQYFYPQFATHNAHTLSAIIELAGRNRDFEFQRLHGMGEALYGAVAPAEEIEAPCRVYAPVGSHEELLPYLVRRLLENGANTSFVNRIVDENLPVTAIVADPIARTRELDAIPHPRIPAPGALFGAERANSRGIDLANEQELAALLPELARAAEGGWRAHPIVAGREGGTGAKRALHDPADKRREVGQVRDASADEAIAAIEVAAAAAGPWSGRPIVERAAILAEVGNQLEARGPEFMALAIREAGKTIPDALSEVREAVDFCRYYAAQARRLGDRALPGPTGERNELLHRGRGVFACISPWNFPLAIFTGQVAAALLAGNAVLAKPAEQTPLIAFEAVRLMHRAGVPVEVLQFLPGPGETVGAALVADPRVAGVAFTGGTDTARQINAALAARPGPLATLIAETGGINAMIVDSSALPEQAVQDVLTSAFRSAGQRCSALRLLCVQEDVAERTIGMLTGAMEELRLGDPGLLSTDIGPVIDDQACRMLESYVAAKLPGVKPLASLVVPSECRYGTYFAPRLFEVERPQAVEREVFGPILHLVRFSAPKLDSLIDAINARGYGLTLGIHSRIDLTIRRIVERARVGNIYINRSQIGAVVGAQPFGGEGLSGTGPKAGGPHYLPRFMLERTVSENVTARGGNAALLALEEKE